MRVAPFLSFLLALALPGQTPGTLRIGTWNLEFLGAEGNFRNNLPPRTGADLAAIGAKVRDLGVAVLAVQEICGPEPLQEVARGAGPSWRFVLGTSGGWDDGKTSQQIGFLYDTTRVELLFAEELLQLPREAEGVPIFHRVPVTAAFRDTATGFDFRATTVHLKAGQKAPDEQKRRLEATALHAWFAGLRQTTGEDPDVVLLGDFNSTYGAEPEAILEAGGLLTYLDQPTPAPTIQHFPEPIDQVVVGPGFGEIRAASLTVHGDYGELTKDAWRKIYSDHFPVTVDLVATGDDDPEAKFARGGHEQALPPTNRPAIAYPSPKSSPAAPRAPGWPPAVGSDVVVHSAAGLITTGRLVSPLPEGPGGWIVLDTRDGRRAIPWGAVEFVSLPAK